MNRRTLFVPRGRDKYHYNFDFSSLGLRDGESIDVVTSKYLTEPYLLSGSRTYEFFITGFAPLVWSPFLTTDPHDANPLD